VKIRPEYVGSVLLGLTLLILIALSVLALTLYPGKKILFLLFCMVFLMVWAMAWFGYKSYLYAIFSSLCLLGFWMKTCAHLITGGEFVEPTGAFDGSGVAWDSSILVSLVAGGAIFCFRASQMLLMRKHKGVFVVEPSSSYAPNWYARFRMHIWLASLFGVTIVAFLNFKLGINQAGLLPKVHLPFKLNAIIIWCLYSAFAFWMAALVWWDTCLGLAFKFEALVFEGVLSSVSVLSRSLYVTHVFHYSLSIFFNKDWIRPTIRKYIYWMVLFVVGMSIVLVSVAELRRDLFYGEVNNAKGASQISVHPKGMASTQFLLLLSQRWIGIEGVMSTSSYPDVGIELFKQGWLDMPSYERKPVYERVANSIYISPDYPNATKYNFLSTPGLVAMLHLSGSLVVVGFGMFMLLIVFSFGEYLIFRLLHNPFILSLYGMIIAMMLHQFGGLYVNLIQLFEIASMMVFLWGIRKIPEYFRSAKSVI
jgi:hypothetical protein